MSVGVSIMPVPGTRGASRDRLMADWTTQDLDPDAVWAHDGGVLGARSADSARNNAMAAALRSTWRSVVVGPEGQQWHSLYQADDARDSSDAERELRLGLAAWHRAAIAGSAWDAQGLRSWRDLQALTLLSEIDYGDAFSLRVAKPRPGVPTLTCVRLIHPLRVGTPTGDRPLGLPAGHEIINGLELDAEGDPVAAWIRRAHPARIRAQAQAWVRVPMLDAAGVRQLTWSSNRQTAEGLRGLGWIGPVAGFLRHLDGTLEAHVVAKRLQACLGMIVEHPDPAKAAAADRNGEVLTSNTKFSPGKTYYCRPGTKVTLLNPNYAGTDLDAFVGLMSQMIAAAFGPGMPYQFVLQQLTRSNMASSRTALLQAWRSAQYQSAGLIADHLSHWLAWQMDEALALGRLTLPTGIDLARATAGRWQGPPRLAPDPLREWNAAERARAQGVAPSTVAAEQGYDFADEIRQTAEDQRLAEAQGVEIAAPTGGAIAVDDEPQPTPTTDEAAP